MKKLLLKLINSPRYLLSYIYQKIYGLIFIFAYRIVSGKPARLETKFGFYSYERSSIYVWLDEIKKKNLIKGLVLDIGSGENNFTKKLFNSDDVDFVNVDLEKKENVDIVCNIYELDTKFSNNYADNIICCDVFEHLENPQLAARQIFNILKNDGTLYLSVPFGYRYHGSKNTKDFFRYTEDGLKYIFKDFKILNITFSGPNKRFPYCFFLIAKK